MDQFQFFVKLLTLLLVVKFCSSIFMADAKLEKMIELTARKPHCRIHTDRAFIQDKILNTDRLKLRQVPMESINMMEDICMAEHEMSNISIQGGLSFIYPGTLWCGPGNLAKNYSDIGRHADEDKCCRAHDNCNLQIHPGECMKSICNHGGFTRFHCDCDEKLRTCLGKLNTETANTIGAALFNTIQVICFEVRRPCSPLQTIGLNETELEERCSRMKYRPSAKFRTRIVTYKVNT